MVCFFIDFINILTSYNDVLNTEITARIREMSKRFPSPFRLWAGLDFFIVITEPEDIEVYVKYSAEKYTIYEPNFNFTGCFDGKVSFVQRQKI